MRVDLPSLFLDAEGHVRYRTGEVIFEQGAPGAAMFVVIEGAVDLVTNGQLVRQVGAGELFGEMSLIDDEPRSLRAVAASEAVLAEVDERRFLFLVHETPMFALHVMGVLAERLRAG